MRLSAPKPAYLGGMGGAIGAALVSFFWIDVVLGTRLDIALGRAIGTALKWGIFGFFGALPLQLSWGRQSGWQPKTILAASLFGADLMLQVIVFLFLEARGESVVFNLISTTSWSLGLWLSPYSAELIQYRHRTAK